MSSPYSFDRMPPAELVAIVLGRNASDRECRQIADCLISESASMESDLLDIARENGPATLKRIQRVMAAAELGRRSLVTRATKKRLCLSRAEDVVTLMEPIYKGTEREVFYALCLDTKNHLKKMAEVSIGSLNASIVHPRELFKEAVRVSAASVVMVHNHPSGDPTPSGADIQITRRIAKAGDILGIEMLDHVVIGGDGQHVSLRDAGLI